MVGTPFDSAHRDLSIEATVIAHLYTSHLYNTHYITERNSIALAWDSPHLQRSWRDHPEMIRDLVISGVK